MPDQSEMSTNALAGALLFYAILFLLASTVGLLGFVLFPHRTSQHLQSLQSQLSKVFLYGILLTVGASLLTLLLGSLEKAIRSGGQQGAEIVGLLIALLVLGFLGLVLVGYGAVAWHLGERVGRAFGWYELTPGACILLGSAVIWAVVWIPVFGWALGVYWLSLAVGGLVARPVPSEANSP